MNTQVVAERPWKRWLQKIEESVRFGVHALGAFLLMLLAGARMLFLVIPAVDTVTTTHPMPYLPANYEVVEGITNIFTEGVRFGGAGGLGFPQVERSLHAYREHERKEATHFLVISPGESTIVDYYDFQLEKVIHTSIQQSSPAWGRWGLLLGSYPAMRGIIESGKLVLERDFVMNGTAFLLSILSMFAAIVIYIVSIRLLIDRLIFNPFFRRLH